MLPDDGGGVDAAPGSEGVSPPPLLLLVLLKFSPTGGRFSPHLLQNFALGFVKAAPHMHDTTRLITPILTRIFKPSPRLRRFKIIIREMFFFFSPMV